MKVDLVVLIKKNNMYKFRIPIGDWSGDGHGKDEDMFIESNKPIKEVRELYFKACDNLGFSLDNSYKKTKLTPMADYEDYSFRKKTLKALLDFGVKISKEDVEFIEEQESTDGYELFTDIILAFIMTQDESLILKRIPNNELPMLQFYGFDEKKRHIGYFGYGLFD